MKARALIVDDEADIRELLSLTLNRMGLATDAAESEFEARQLLQKQQYDVCLTDMRLPDGDGLALLQHAARFWPRMPVAVITAYGSAENAVAALKAGAFDYLAKPVQVNQLRALVKSALKLSEDNAAAASADAAAAEAGASGTHTLLGESEPMRQTRAMIDRLARSQAPIHVSGESGCGKELAAKLIHQKSVRHERPFVPVNCGAIPENLVESEFFGYRKGAFTGADGERGGFFQAADGGTLFLDEVAELPLLMQVKLLRAIQEKRVRKVGATQEEAVDVRVISATHKDLAEEVKAGRFRQDLFYRLNVIELKMPSLRDMPEDIGLLAQAFLERRGAQDAMPVPVLSAGAVRALEDYPFPGNVRELENVLERALALCSGSEIGRDDLQLKAAAAEAPDIRGLPLEDYLATIEKQAIVEALEKTRYNRTAAAKILGISFRQLRYRMERLGIE
ncbi:MAG: sigma-54 dependent transcriptional regulator [Burkholderiales bacterium]|jgi:two-component system, NtrC family, response regulator PilR|nr:sigma-54 dependent transcriptional regulator [Burkholderiales bacterium]